jgi:hypothetical protein
MANRKLALYIRDTLLQGYRLDDIKLKLKQTGYSESEIKESIDACHSMLEK